jgi:superfamily I DNA/RNA helicase
MNDLYISYYEKDRKKYSDAITNSPSRKKLIIAGPGTGKTHIFKALFKKTKVTSGEKGLALTFIRNLVADLKIELAGLAKVSTFHAFCKSIIHSFRNEHFEYYPSLFRIIGKDFEFLGMENINNEDIERCFFGLKDAKIIGSTLKIGDYYNASGHSDSVYRVIKYFEAYPNRIPIYPLIVVDEYQDFNFLEISLIEVLSRKSPVLIVGDDDQALYAFKQASTDYIRRLFQDPEFQKYELPYCSRCTKVIVEAVNKIIHVASKNGHLQGRVDKPFKYFPPDKELDSKRHPNIINVRCTVERKNCHYMGKYIVEEISTIPKSYIQESKKRREPTVLIIGPGQFLRGIKKELKDKFGYEEEEKAKGDEVIDILDGYKSLSKNPKSRLGWRILVHCDPCSNSNAVIKRAISAESDIYDHIPSKQYIAKHEELATLIKKILSAEALNLFEQKTIEDAINLSLNEIKSKILEEEAGIEPKKFLQKEDNTPDILCTSFEGSKGLAAQYVFIAGANENHFPQRIPPSNREICRLIVALTRARKKCYMIFCNRFGNEQLNPSIFMQWLKEKLAKEIYVDREYIKRFCN